MNPTIAPKISVISITNNHAHVLETALKSVAYQDFQNWEWLIFDNASTDETPQILSRFEHIEPRAKVFLLSKPQNLTEIYNQAFEMATGQYIAFLEPENVWVKNKLGDQLSFMSRYRPEMCHTSYAFIDAQCHVLPVGCSHAEPLINMVNFDKGPYLQLSSLMLKTAKLKKVFPLPAFKNTSDDFLGALMNKGVASVGINEVLSLCRLRYAPPTKPDYDDRLQKLSQALAAEGKKLPNAVRYDAFKADNVARIDLKPSHYILNDVYISMDELLNFNLNGIS